MQVRELPLEARHFVYLLIIGYIRVCTTTGSLASFQESKFWKQQKSENWHTHDIGEPEFFVTLNWIKTIPNEDPIYGNNIFASPNSTCKLSDRKTLKVISENLTHDEWNWRALCFFNCTCGWSPRKEAFGSPWSLLEVKIRFKHHMKLIGTTIKNGEMLNRPTKEGMSNWYFLDSKTVLYFTIVNND